MTRLTTETLTTVREAADEPRTVEGIAVPYGTIATDTDLGPEAFAPGAFSASIAHWQTRTDGARMAFRPAHREKPIGTVTELADTPAGVRFRAAIFDTPAGDEYLSGVRAGLNGVSVEVGLNRDSRRLKDGTVLHRSARLHAIAGSISPAYDGARIALRDMQETPPMDDQDSPTTEAPAPAERSAIERADPILASIVRTPAIVTRPELVYRPGSGNSFLRDVVLASSGDSAAAERQSRHNAHLTDIAGQIERAGEVLSSEIPGAFPNEYMPGLLTPRILKGRPMGGFFARVGIADARPRVFAKVSTSTSVAVQSAEGANPAASDFATTAVTANPLLYGAVTDVSRQVIDGGDPAAEGMILSDMIEAYAQASETVIKTAVEAGSSASGTAITAATPFAGTLGNVITYYGTRFRPAEAQFVPAALFSVLLQEADSAGRPKMPWLGPINSSATTQTGGGAGEILGAATKLSYASTTNLVVTARADDFVIYESSIARFSYEQVAGPGSIRLGIWAYLVVGTRLGSLKVTAA